MAGGRGEIGVVLCFLEKLEKQLNKLLNKSQIHILDNIIHAREIMNIKQDQFF